MNVTAWKSALVEELGYVLSSYAKSTPEDRPVVQLSLFSGELTLLTEDGRRGLKSAIPVEGMSEMHNVQVNGDLLRDYLDLVRSKRVRLIGNGTSLTVEHEDGSMTVPAIIKPIPLRDFSDAVLYSGSYKREDIETLAAAAGFASIKRADTYITGTLLSLTPGKLRMAASDQYVVAMVDVPTDNDISLDFVVPVDAFAQLTRILRGAKADTVTLERRERNIVACCGPRRFVMTLAEGKFPPVNRLEAAFPKTFGTTVTVDSEILLDAVKRAIMNHTDKDKSLELVIFGNEITLVSPGSREILQIIDKTGEAVTIKLDAQYLRGVLENTPAPQIDICIVDPTKPFTFVPAWPNGKAQYLVTPRTK